MQTVISFSLSERPGGGSLLHSAIELPPRRDTPVPQNAIEVDGAMRGWLIDIEDACGILGIACSNPSAWLTKVWADGQSLRFLAALPKARP